MKIELLIIVRYYLVLIVESKVIGLGGIADPSAREKASTVHSGVRHLLLAAFHPLHLLEISSPILNFP